MEQDGVKGIYLEVEQKRDWNRTGRDPLLKPKAKLPPAPTPHPSTLQHPTNVFSTQTEGDRKAYFETSQWTMKQNKDTIAACKVRGAC